MRRFKITLLAGAALLSFMAARTTATAGVRHAEAAVYLDATGDAGDAPDIASVTILPVAGGVAVDVKLAGPTRLGPYGWLLFGVDTDRNPYTGGSRGDDLLVLANGEGTTLARWTDGRFSPDFTHQDIDAELSGTDLTFVLSWTDLPARSFGFSVASLCQDADLAPGFGTATYPQPPAHHRYRVHRADWPRAISRR